MHISYHVYLLSAICVDMYGNLVCVDLCNFASFTLLLLLTYYLINYLHFTLYTLTYYYYYYM